MQLTKNFHLSEFACKDKNQTPVPAEYMPNVTLLAENLQVLRDFIDQPIDLNSAYRTPAYNEKVGGSPKSQHLVALAGDIDCSELNWTPRQIAKIIESLIELGLMTEGGIGIYSTFVHYDARGTKARWKG